MADVANSVWGAHASSVLVSAFCGDELSLCSPQSSGHSRFAKFVSARCRNQHAGSVRSPDFRVHLDE